MRSLPRASVHERRGVVLLVVLGMLFLFAAVGLAFAMIARTHATGAYNFKRSDFSTNALPVGAGTDPADQDPVPFLRDIMGQIIYEPSLTTTNTALRGHSLLRDMYGGAAGPDAADPRANNASSSDDPSLPGAPIVAAGPYAMGTNAYLAATPGNLPWRNWWRNAFNGSGIRAPGPFDDNDMSVGGPNNTAIVDAFRIPYGVTTAEGSYPFNFIQFDAVGTRTALATPANRVPEKYVVGGTTEYYGYDEDYDYPDWNNMFLAQQRPDGWVITPSYHRPQLIWDLERRGAFGGNAWADNDGWRVILRPRRREYAGGAAVGANVLTNPQRTAGTGFDATVNGWADLVDLDGSGICGDHPSELDVDTDGDGLKDAIWIDFGAAPILDPVSGEFFKPLAAIKILDLAGGIPASTAGNMLAGAGAHSSNLGASPAEINPKPAMVFIDDTSRSGDVTKLFNGDAGSSTAGKYTPATGTPGNTDTAGATGVDDIEAAAGVSPASRRTAVPVPVHASIPTAENYPAGWFEERWMGNIHPGYDNAGEYHQLWNAGPVAPIDQRAGTLSYGLRDNIGLGRFARPGVAPTTVGAGTPAPHPRDIMGYFGQYEREQANKSTDDPTELNPYESAMDTDTRFAESLFDTLFRYNDIDSTVQRDTLVRLMASSLQSIQGEQTRHYGRTRSRRMFSPTLWDLIHYNAPPEFNLSTTPAGGDDISDHAAVNATFANRHNGSFDGAVPVDGITAIGDPAPPDLPAQAPLVSDSQYIVNPVQNIGTDFSVFHPQADIASTTAPPYSTTPFNLYPQELLEGRRFNLNRPLRQYRETNRASADLLDNVGAEVDRHMLAAQIYLILRGATHTRDADPPERIRQLAQLAVNIVDFMDPDDVMTLFHFDVAVNDTSWAPAAGDVVYGFELPRLVINEASAFFHDNFDPAMTGTERDTTWVFAELSNPWPANTDIDPASDNDELQVGTRAENSAEIVTPFSEITSRSLAKVWRLQIELPGTTQENDFSHANAVVDATRGRAIRGKNAPDSSNDDISFFVVGPAFTDPALRPPGETFLTDLEPFNDSRTDVDFGLDELCMFSLPDNTQRPAEVRIRLQRLRNPYDSPNSDANFNPYVTVDEVIITGGDGTSSGHVWNITRVMMGMPASAIADRKSWERFQPWENQGGESTNAEGHTLNFDAGTRSHVNSVEATSNYIHFLNRPLATPLELLNVRLFGAGDSVGNPLVTTLGSPKMNLTQLFRPNVAQIVPWFRDRHDDDTAPNLNIGGDLFRFFEFVETPSRFLGAGANWRPLPFNDATFRYPDHRATRVAGKMNANAITSEEVFRGWLDSDEANPPGTPQQYGGNPFTWVSPTLPSPYQPHLFLTQFPIGAGSGAYSGAGERPDRLVNSEMFKNYLLSLAGQDEILGTADDKPFRSYAARSIADTLLRPRGHDRLNYTDVSSAMDRTARDARLFDAMSSDPTAEPVDNSELYDRNRILAKLAGNTTTRGNVFGVWVTIGWFRVVPLTDGLQVPLLDKEMGIDTGGNIRHRAFFVVDRTLAPAYYGPKAITDFTQEPLITYYRVIE